MEFFLGISYQQSVKNSGKSKSKHAQLKRSSLCLYRLAKNHTDTVDLSALLCSTTKKTLEFSALGIIESHDPNLNQTQVSKPMFLNCTNISQPNFQGRP